MCGELGQLVKSKFLGYGEDMNMSRDIAGDYWNQFRNNTKSATAALSELIDNCLDAGASKIQIDYTGGVDGGLMVKDDGEGMDSDGLEKMFRLGGSTRKQNANASGRYGHGAKVGMAHFGNVFEVVTVRDRLATKWKWDTEQDVNSDIWKQGLRKFRPNKTSKPNGTEITVTSLRRKRPPMERLAEDLSWQFTPAIDKGIQILLNGEKLKSAQVPWEGIVYLHSGEINGQKYSMQYGRINKTVHGHSQYLGVHCVRVNRYVPDISEWRDPVDAVPLCCVVHLEVNDKSDWTLDSMKTALAEQSLRDSLECEIRQVCKHEIEKFRQEDKEIQVQVFEGLLNEMVSRVFARTQQGNQKATASEDGDATVLEGHEKGKGGNSSPRNQKKCTVTDGDTHSAAGGLLRFRFIDLDDQFTAVHYDKKEAKVVVSFNVNSLAYDQQKPDHVMYMVSAGYAIASKMREDVRFMQMIPQWTKYMEERNWGKDTNNIDSRFCQWFQEKVLGISSSSNTQSAA